MDYQLTSQYNEDNRVWEIKASGEIDIFNSNEFRDQINAFLLEKPADLCIDCGELRYIDSTALGVLVSLLKTVKGYNGEIKLRNVNGNMLRLLRITNLDKSFLLAE